MNNSVISFQKKSATDAICALRMLRGERALPCVFVDFEKGYDRVLRQEI